MSEETEGISLQNTNKEKKEDLINQKTTEEKTEKAKFDITSKTSLIIIGTIAIILIITGIVLYILSELRIIFHPKKTIYLIATGGTIASTKKEGHLTPTLDLKDLLKKVPELNKLCKLEGKQLFNKDSTNVKYSDWHKVALKIQELYDKYDGFVVTHGTDTMAFGAAMMSYFIQNSKKPIIFVGSQKSIDDNVTDAKRNLYDSVVVAISDKINGVKLVFDGKIIDGFRAKKMRSVSYNAFYSIDYKPDIVLNGEVILNNEPKEIKSPVKFSLDYDDRVFVLQFTPGIKYNVLNILKNDFKVIILEGFGMGGVPNYEGKSDDDNKFIEEIKKIRKENGVEFIAATQVIYEGTQLGVYQVGNINLIETYSMTIEAAIAKCMWALGQSKGDMNLFRTIFQTPIGCDRFKSG